VKARVLPAGKKLLPLDLKVKEGGGGGGATTSATTKKFVVPRGQSSAEREGKGWFAIIQEKSKEKEGKRIGTTNIWALKEFQLDFPACWSGPKKNNIGTVAEEGGGKKRESDRHRLAIGGSREKKKRSSKKEKKQKRVGNRTRRQTKKFKDSVQCGRRQSRNGTGRERGGLPQLSA